MKNIEKEMLYAYNLNYENKEILDKYMRLNLAHLEDDKKRMKKHLKYLAYVNNMYAVCNDIYLKILKNQKLTEEDILAFDEINKYNTAKNKELKLIAVLSVVFSILAIGFSFLF